MPVSALQTRTLESFNNGLPLRVVRIDGETLGVVDESRIRVWVNQSIESTFVPNVHTLEQIHIPDVPGQYGRWVKKSIGGVSTTVRHLGAIRAAPKVREPIIVFAIRAPTETTIRDAFSTRDDTHNTLSMTLGDSEHDEEYGFVTEIIIHCADEVEHICSVIARCGAIPMLEDPKVNARRGLGIERLDRISARVVSSPDDDECVESEGREANSGDSAGIDETAHGPRRGTDNWRFPWMPDHWTRPPITWDHMIENVSSDSIETLPQPLRQHVARARLNDGAFERPGVRWCEAEAPPSVSELSYREDDDPPQPLRRIVTIPSLSEAIARGTVRFDPTTVEAWGVSIDNRCIVQSTDGRWYRPRDTRNFLMKHTRGKRWVSAALEDVQSRQLITAFYLLIVERVRDTDTKRACELILYHYMMERGYTARWMGKYDQFAIYIGNGDQFRKFRRLSQYDPERIPIEVLNKLCGRNGRLRNRGSKGTRSKYKKIGRYIPKRRLKRSVHDEERMVSTHAP